jgi:hypothetical protein
MELMLVVAGVGIGEPAGTRKTVEVRVFAWGLYNSCSLISLVLAARLARMSTERPVAKEVCVSEGIIVRSTEND